MTPIIRRPAKTTKEGDDILDPERRTPLVLSNGVTVRFPAHWTKEHRDMWREVWTREAYLRARGKG